MMKAKWESPIGLRLIVLHTYIHFLRERKKYNKKKILVDT